MCYQTGLPLDKFWALHSGSTTSEGEEASRFHAAGGGEVISIIVVIAVALRLVLVLV